MGDKEWMSKGDKLPRRSPRKTGKTCGRPFKAPRSIKELEGSDVIVIATEVETGRDSEVQAITETENERELKSRQEAQGNSSDSEDDIPFSTLSQRDKVQETITETVQETRLSDTTESTPEIFRSPVTETVVVVQNKVALDLLGQQLFEASNQSGNQMTLNGKPFLGVTFVPETEAQVESSDSDDNVPIATSIRKEKGSTLTIQQIKDFYGQ